MSPRWQEPGRYRLTYDGNLDEWERGLAMQVTCLFCGARFDGTVEEGVAWHAAHRAEAHPGARDRGQFVRQRAAKQAAA